MRVGCLQISHQFHMPVVETGVHLIQVRSPVGLLAAVTEGDHAIVGARAAIAGSLGSIPAVAALPIRASVRVRASAGPVPIPTDVWRGRGIRVARTVGDMNLDGRV